MPSHDKAENKTHFTDSLYFPSFVYIYILQSPFLEAHLEEEEENEEIHSVDLGPVCFSIWMSHLDEDESFVCLDTKSAIYSDESSE